MFQYTTETIINSNKGKLANGKRFDIIDPYGTSKVVYNSTTGAVTSASAANGDTLLIDGVNSFKKEYISKIYRTGYRASKNATATLDLSGATIPSTKGTILRLTVSIREQGSVRSTIQNAYLHKNKPFHYEIELPASATAANVVDALVKLIKKDMAMTDFAYFKASAGAKAATPAVFDQLILTADDCYIQFDDVELVEVLEGVDGDGSTLGARLLGYKVTKAITGLSAPEITLGDEGQGTVTRLVKNLRIPTNASINPFGADQGGKPVPGGKYDQFLIEYVTDRHHVSGTVVGSVGEKSLTSHVLFVESGIASDIAIILGAMCTITPAGRLADDNTTVGANLVTTTDVTGNSELAPVGALKEKSEMGSVE